MFDPPPSLTLAGSCPIGLDLGMRRLKLVPVMEDPAVLTILHEWHPQAGGHELRG